MNTAKIVKNANEIASIVLSQALKASKQGTFGVGGCIVNNKTNEIVHRLHNNVLKPLKDGSGVFTYDPTAHGERQLIDWYFTNRKAKGLPKPKDLTIVTSLDPCAMCAGALLTAGFNVAIVANDDFAGINYDASFSFKSLPDSLREKAKNTFGYYGCIKTSSIETTAKNYIGGEEVIFNGENVDTRNYKGCADAFQKSVDLVRSDSSNLGLPPDKLKDPAELPNTSATRITLQKICKYALNKKYKQKEPRLPDFKLKALLSKTKKKQSRAKNAVALLDPFGNLLCCLPDTLSESPIKTAFMNVTRAYAKTRFELTNNPETRDESTQYLTHPKYGTFVFLHIPEPDEPETIMILGAYGSTMEGPIPNNFPANFQYYLSPKDGEKWKLRRLIMNLPPFYTQWVVLAVQKVAKFYEQD